MLILCGLILFLTPVFLGIFVTGIRKEGMKESKENSNRSALYADFRYVYLIGVCTMLLLAMGAVLAADALGIGLRAFAWSYLCIIVMLCIAGITLFRRCIDRCFGNIRITKYDMIPIILFLLLLPSVFMYLPDVSSDTILETMLTAIHTDSLFEYNPLTGEILAISLPFTEKLNILPYFYASFIGISGALTESFLYYIVPGWVLFLTFLVTGLWSDSLFEPEEHREKSAFISCVGVLLLFGNYLFTSPSYLLFHRGWTGETIAVVVMIPFLLYLLTCAYDKKTRRIWPVLLSLMTFFTLVSVHAAAGYLLIVIAIRILAKPVSFLVRRFL